MKKDAITDFHSTGLYLDKRIIELTGAIDRDMYSNFLKNFIPLTYTDKPITIILNSEGGSVVSGFAIYDLIMACNCHINIVVLGEACSSASFILQAADERILSDTSQVMIHRGHEAYDEDDPKNIERWMKRNKQLGDKMSDIYFDKIKQVDKSFTKKRLQNMMQPDTILTAEKAIELGLADSILTELKF